MLLGDEVAVTLGVKLVVYRRVYMVLSALLTSIIVANSGMIGFVGLIIPHIVRGFSGSDHRILMPLTALSGGLFLIWADILARSILTGVELPIGIITAIIGAPIFIYIIVKRQYNFGGKQMKLSVEHVSYQINQQPILQDISLKTLEGQFVGLIGSNGSGKSTLLKSIYKTLKPDAGEMYLDDLNILQSAEKKVAQQMSVVSQFNELSFDLTVEQMVLLGRTPHKAMLEKENQRDFSLVEQALQQTGLEGYRQRSFLSLSGGEKQRVVLARAIAQDPKFMILDEPTNHLDIRYQLEILEIVKGLGIGVLAALHNLEEAARYCDYLYVLKKGTVVAQGKPEEVLTESLIESVYGIRCKVYRNPITNGLGFYYYVGEEEK